MSKAIRNPSPSDIEKINFQYQTEAETKTPTSGISNGNFAVNQNSMFKTENMFSPEKHKHKLIFKYKNIENIEEEQFIYIRRMTAIEEGLFYDIINKENSSTIDFLNIVNNVLDNCIRNNISVYDLNIIEKLVLFIHILILSYGEKHSIELECPYCLEKYMVQINLKEDIKIKYLQEDEEVPKIIKLNSYPYDIYVKVMPPTLKYEEAYLSSETKWLEKLMLIVYEISGNLINNQPITTENYNDILTNLNKNDLNNIKEANDNIINNYGIHLDDVEIPNFCSNRKCNYHEKTIRVQIPLDFLFLTVFNNI